MKAKGAMEESKRALNAPFDTPSARQGIGKAAHMGVFRSSIDTFLHADDFLFGDKNDTPSARQGIGKAAHMGVFRSSIDTFLHADDFLFGDKNVTKCL